MNSQKGYFKQVGDYIICKTILMVSFLFVKKKNPSEGWCSLYHWGAPQLL